VVKPQNILQSTPNPFSCSRKCRLPDILTLAILILREVDFTDSSPDIGARFAKIRDTACQASDEDLSAVRYGLEFGI
jgi:hypothetical protein